MLVQKQLKKAILQSMLGKYSLYVFQLATISILARFFAPEVFGVVAAAQVFILFFQTVITGALAPAVVDRGQVSNLERDGIFSFTLLLGLFFSIVLFFTAPTIFDWLEFSDGIIVFYLLCPSVLFAAISMMPFAALQKDAKFLLIARAEIFAESIALCIAVILSFYYSPYVALSVRLFAVAFFRLFFYILFSSRSSLGRPRFSRQVGQIAKLFDYAKYQVMFNTMNFFSTNLDSLVVAKYFGASSLGSYEKTYQVMRYPLILFTYALTPALQPILTNYKSKPKIILAEYYSLVAVLSALGLFSGTMLYTSANEIVFILFGQQWESSVALLKILCLSVPIQMVLSSTGGIYQSFGKTRLLFYCGIFGLLTSLCAIGLGVYFSSLTVMCVAIVVAINLNFIQCFVLLFATVFKGLNWSPIFYSFIICNFVMLQLFFNIDSQVYPNKYSTAILGIIYKIGIVSAPIFCLYLIYSRFINLKKCELLTRD